MSDHITYNSFYSRLARFSFVCSKFNDFDIRSRNLLESLLNRVFSKYRLKNSFKKILLNHHDVLDIKYSVTRPFYESRVNWVTDPAPPASRRPTIEVSPAPTPAILMPSSGASSQPPRRQKSRRRRRRKAARSANHNSASRQADLATPAERTANDNSAHRRATQPRSTANDLPGMKSTPVEHPHSFTSSLLTQPPISAANQNSGISSRQDRSEIWGVYKPAQTDPRQDLYDATEHANNENIRDHYWWPRVGRAYASDPPEPIYTTI